MSLWEHYVCIKFCLKFCTDIISQISLNNQFDKFFNWGYLIKVLMVSFDFWHTDKYLSQKETETIFPCWMLSLGPVIPKFTQNFDISTKIFRIDPNVPHNFIWQRLNLGCGHVQCWIGRDLGWWESLTVVPARNKANCLLSINHSAKTLYHIINKTEQLLDNMSNLSSVIPYEIMC